MSAPLDVFVVTAPGLEAITAAELAELGVEGESEHGGIAVRLARRDLYRLALHLETASGLLLRLGSFRARTFAELERHAAEMPWDRVLAPGTAVTFDVTARKSKLYHTGAVAERLGRAATEAVRGVVVEKRPDARRLVARIVRDELVLSADAAGEPLHRRGYRLETAKAPLRETLAAAVLRAGGWSPGLPLVDPLCGAGTLVIEAARRARGIPPGWDRAFAFQDWPDFDEALWTELRRSASDGMRSSGPAPIEGSDRDRGAVRAARANAERAGVAADVVFHRRPISEAEAPEAAAGPGWIVTNPPYGHRVGRPGPLRDLYARLGSVARERFPGWGLAVLTADPALAGQVGPDAETVLTTRNGNVPVRLYRWPGIPS